MSKKDKDKLLNLTNSNDLKRALSFLYYDYKNLQKAFISQLDLETLDNLKGSVIKPVD